MATTAATTVSIADALHLARAAGFPADQLVTAVAVAKAESRLNPRAKNDTPATGDYSIGLWQINMRPEAHGTRFGTELQLMNPGTNARAAYQVWKDAGRKWTPWGAWKNNLHLPFVDEVARVATSGAVTGRAFQGIEIGPEDIPIIGPAIEDVGDIAAGGLGGLGGLGGVIRDVFNLDDLFSQALIVVMQMVFSIAALAIIALGLFRLTGTDAGDLFKAGSKAAGGAGAIKAVL